MSGTCRIYDGNKTGAELLKESKCFYNFNQIILEKEREREKYSCNIISLFKKVIFLYSFLYIFISLYSFLYIQLSSCLVKIKITSYIIP